MLRSRKDNVWGNSQENLWAIIALGQYFEGILVFILFLLFSSLCSYFSLFIIYLNSM